MDIQSYKELLAIGPNKADKDTGLLLPNALNRELQKCLMLQEETNVLAILDVDSLANLNLEHGYDGANTKIVQIGNVINKYCNKNSNQMKGYRLLENGKFDVFAIILKYSKRIKSCERWILRLMKQIETLTNQTVSVGMAKFNGYEMSYNEWKHILVHLTHC